MNKIFKIAHREYIATTKTKSFVIGIFIGPIIIGLLMLFGSKGGKLMSGGPKPTVHIGITDETGELESILTEKFEQHCNEKPDDKINAYFYGHVDGNEPNYSEGKNALRDGDIEAYYVIKNSVLDESAKVAEYTYKTKPGNVKAIWKSKNIIKNVIVDHRCVDRGLDREQINQLWWINFDEIVIGRVDAEEKKSRDEDMKITMTMPFAMMFLIYIGIIGIGQHMLSSVIEEKNSRIIEVLLSAVSPFQLMSGKIFGLVGVGLTVVAVWCLIGLAAVNYMDIQIDLTGEFWVVFLFYYILGFMFFSALLAAAGSLCNTIKESQSLMMPVVMVLIIPMLSWFQLAKNPNGIYATTLSFIPPISPLVMVLRLSASSEVPKGQIILSLTFLALSVLFAFWFAGKVFKTGILMYGKKPKLREVYRWIKSK